MTECYGIYRGLVSNDNDPEGLSRIKAICPQIFGNDSTETDWAWPCIAPGGGTYPPSAGHNVWLQFVGGDVNYPVWMGVWS